MARPAQSDKSCADSAERRRAAAYIDLWERQLRHTASHGSVAPNTGRKPRS